VVAAVPNATRQWVLQPTLPSKPHDGVGARNRNKKGGSHLQATKIREPANLRGGMCGMSEPEFAKKGFLCLFLFFLPPSSFVEIFLPAVDPIEGVNRRIDQRA
jgi:hypothetical protein